MRVIHLIGTGQVGGTLHTALALARAQLNAGLKAEVWISLRSQQSEAESLRTNLGIPGGTLSRFSMAMCLLRLRFAEPVVVHLHGGGNGASPTEQRLPSLFGRKHKSILSIHMSFELLKARRYSCIDRFIAKSGSPFDVITVPSEAERKYWLAAGMPSQRIQVLGSCVPSVNGVPGRLRKQLALRQDALVVAFCGRLVGSKGIELLTTAFRCVLESFPTATLVVAGDGPLLEVLRRDTDDLGASIRWLGHLESVGDLYADADVLVNPSRGESFGLGTYQGAVIGLPMVLSPITPWTDDFRDGEDCVFFKSFSTEAVAEAIVTVLADRHLRQRLAESVRRHVGAQYESKAISMRSVELYRFGRPK